MYFSRNTIIYDEEDEKIEEKNKILDTEENTEDENNGNGIKLIGVKYKPENEQDQEENTLHNENEII